MGERMAAVATCDLDPGFVGLVDGTVCNSIAVPPYLVRVMTSQTSSRLSMATSLLVALKSGALYLVGQAFSSC